MSWPVSFAVDSFWGNLLLPHVQSIREGRWVQEAEAASLLPKAAGSYLGAHLFVPRAWSNPLSWQWQSALKRGSTQGSGVYAAGALEASSRSRTAALWAPEQSYSRSLEHLPQPMGRFQCI